MTSVVGGCSGAMDVAQWSSAYPSPLQPGIDLHHWEERKWGNSIFTVYLATCSHRCHKISNLPKTTAATGRKGCQLPCVSRSKDLTEVDLCEFEASQAYIPRPVSNNIERPTHIISTPNFFQFFFYKTFHML